MFLQSFCLLDKIWTKRVLNSALYLSGFKAHQLALLFPASSAFMFLHPTSHVACQGAWSRCWLPSCKNRPAFSPRYSRCCLPVPSPLCGMPTHGAACPDINSRWCCWLRNVWAAKVSATPGISRSFHSKDGVPQKTDQGPARSKVGKLQRR